jgi:ATP-dependent DNA ligase
MTLPIKYSYRPMEARTANELPTGSEWQYEPKWDGFRCLAFKDGARVELRSKSGRSLSRYFPELMAALAALRAPCFVLDGEIVVPDGESFSFDALLQRIHPAKSRVQLLSTETPAMLIIFDLLVDDRGTRLTEIPLETRSTRVSAFAKKYLRSAAVQRTIRQSPMTSDIRIARRWLKGQSGLDGVIAKHRELPYQTGDRTGMIKVKRIRTADCVVGGFRYASKGHVIGSLLLGLYDGAGLLHHVGFTSSFTADERKALVPTLERLIKAPGFTGQAPGGPSRWSTKRSSEWEPLVPKLVVEVTYDHFSSHRFRHGTTLVRWRPDKAPRQCTIEQVEMEGRSAMRMLRGRRS